MAPDDDDTDSLHSQGMHSQGRNSGTPTPQDALSSPTHRKHLMETWLLLEFCNRGCISDAVEKGWFRQQQQGPGSGLQGALAGPGGATLQQQLAADSSLTSKSSSFSGGLVSAAPDLPAILATAREVAAAMSYLHHKGMLHGDLTGNNVLLTAAPAERRGYIAKVGGWGGGLLY